MLGYGDHQLIEHELDTNYFAVGGISAIYFNRFSNAVRIGLGTDINYWWGLNALPDGSPGPYSFENITVGLILQPRSNHRQTVAGEWIWNLCEAPELW
jgi:hypothetical protein